MLQENEAAKHEEAANARKQCAAPLDASRAAEELPDGVVQMESTEPLKKRRRRLSEKNATPGDGARSLEQCLEDIRPHAMCVDKSVQACSDPGTLREGALERYGELHTQTGGKEILQFHSKYFSQVLPFVIPYMVSGPDYFPDQRWRRKHANDQWVSPKEFEAAF